jgi:MtfA peptidase
MVLRERRVLKIFLSCNLQLLIFVNSATQALISAQMSTYHGTPNQDRLAMGLIRSLRRKQIRERPFPSEWRHFLNEQIAYAHILSSEERIRWEESISIFLDEKKFIPVDADDFSDTDKLNIAAQATLLILNLERGIYDWLTDIIIYPTAYRAQVKEADEFGIVTEGEDIRLGESWHLDQVVLSLEEIRCTLPMPNGETNIIIHEFVHQLDAEDGSTNGAPILRDGKQYQSWYQTFQKEFDQLQADYRRRRDTVLSPYGTENPAEFFAVAAESFFLTPIELSQRHPKLFEELKNYFHLDPRRIF